MIFYIAFLDTGLVKNFAFKLFSLRLKSFLFSIHSANKNREIQAMRRLASHPNVLKMKEILL